MYTCLAVNGIKHANVAIGSFKTGKISLAPDYKYWEESHGIIIIWTLTPEQQALHCSAAVCGFVLCQVCCVFWIFDPWHLSHMFFFFL